MLIQTDRHRQEDLALWCEYENADLEHGQKHLWAKVKSAFGEIELFRADGRAYCSVSWGKDSVVVADLVMRVAPSTPIRHLRVEPSHNPECDQVRDAFLKIWPACDYAEETVDYGDLDRSVLGEQYDRDTDQRFFAGFR